MSFIRFLVPSLKYLNFIEIHAKFFNLVHSDLMTESKYVLRVTVQTNSRECKQLSEKIEVGFIAGKRQHAIARFQRFKLYTSNSSTIHFSFFNYRIVWF